MLAWIQNRRLRSKILLAPAFLILVLIGLGTYALQIRGTNRASAESLMAGPMLQAEIVADFSPAVWAAQARLYHLTATAANEIDQNKIRAVAARTSSTLAEVEDKLRAFQTV